MPMVAASCSYLSSPWSPAPPVRPSPGTLPRPVVLANFDEYHAEQSECRSISEFPNCRFSKTWGHFAVGPVGDIASFIRSPRRRK
jgi:hypothetical protein